MSHKVQQMEQYQITEKGICKHYNSVYFFDNQTHGRFLVMGMQLHIALSVRWLVSRLVCQKYY